MDIVVFKNFSDITNPHITSIENVLARIKNGASKDKILDIRTKTQAGNKCVEEKKSLPCVVFSASKVRAVTTKRDYETYREDGCVAIHSGLFTIDFDKCEPAYKLDQLREDPYIYAAWVSPTATGVRALVKCPPSIENHNLYYTAFLDRYPELDSTSRNISRVTFESWDENIFINPNSLIWDKRLTEDQRKKNKDKEVNRRGTKLLATAVSMVRASYDGNKHDVLRNAAVLLGGYIASGRVDEDAAFKVLDEEIRAKNPSDLHGAHKTIRDGFDFGKSRPLIESKKIEKAQQFLRREDGSYDFLADSEEMTEYELAVINGTLEMGLPTGLNKLNEHWMFKKRHIVWFVGADNVGKSFMLWYLPVLAAKFHGWKVILHSAENGDGQLRKKLKEFYIGKSLKLMDDEELTLSDDFVKTHFRIISSKQMHSVEDFLIKCEILIDEGFEADVVIAEPWNSFDEKGTDRYGTVIHNMNLLRVFKENYCSVWVADHINTFAARQKDKDGFALAPSKSDVEQGQMKANKTDDFIVIHRLGNHPERKRDIQIHVVKVRDEETGGQKTDKDSPVILQMNADYCGYTCGHIDPIKHKRL
jgi:hypothetical protein